MRHSFTVYGEVRGQARPRVAYNRKSLYKPPQDKKYERRIKEAYVNSGGGHFGKKPIAMAVVSYRELPQSRPKRIQSEDDIFKPDSSNILKSVEDALNKLAYDDDKQIVVALAAKAPRERDGIERLEVMISDEMDVIELIKRIKEEF